jgi:putative MATE family efflux protein
MLLSPPSCRAPLPVVVSIALLWLLASGDICFLLVQGLHVPAATFRFRQHADTTAVTLLRNYDNNKAKVSCCPKIRSRRPSTTSLRLACIANADASDNRDQNRKHNQNHDQNNNSNTDLYSYARLAVFTLTVCGNWFAEPIQSLVDTVAVGTVSTLQLAALGPATLVFDASLFLCYFLSIATTNLLGAAIARQDNVEQRNVVSHSLGMAVLMGLGIMGIMFRFGPAILGWMVGDANLALVPAAMSYIHIRVLAAPISLVGQVAQATSLAYLDTTTPATAVLVATALNIIGDYLLCIVGDFGIQGAAVATAVSQVVSCAMVLSKTIQRHKSFNDDDNKVPFISIPGRADFMRLVGLGGPIVFVIVGEIMCQLLLTRQATLCGMTSLATHNIILRLYLFGATFGDGLSRTVQAFLPRLLFGTTKDNKDQLRTLFARLFALGGGIAVMCSIATTILTRYMGSLFAPNIAMVYIMKTVSPWLGAIFLLQPINLLCEGSAIAKRDFSFLVALYGSSIALLASLLGGCTSLASIWRSFFFFQLFRMAQFGVRSSKPRRTEGTAV